jgi:hypothetical protein
MIYLNEEVNCTEPFPSVSTPWTNSPALPGVIVIMMSVIGLNVMAPFKVLVLGFIKSSAWFLSVVIFPIYCSVNQGTLSDGEGSVQLTSLY